MEAQPDRTKSPASEATAAVANRARKFFLAATSLGTACELRESELVKNNLGNKTAYRSWDMNNPAFS